MKNMQTVIHNSLVNVIRYENVQIHYFSGYSRTALSILKVIMMHMDNARKMSMELKLK